MQSTMSARSPFISQACPRSGEKDRAFQLLSRTLKLSCPENPLGQGRAPSSSAPKKNKPSRAKRWRYASFAGLAGVDATDYRAQAAGLPPHDSKARGGSKMIRTRRNFEGTPFWGRLRTKHQAKKPSLSLFVWCFFCISDFETHP